MGWWPKCIWPMQSISKSKGQNLYTLEETSQNNYLIWWRSNTTGRSHNNRTWLSYKEPSQQKNGEAKKKGRHKTEGLQNTWHKTRAWLFENIPHLHLPIVLWASSSLHLQTLHLLLLLFPDFSGVELGVVSSRALLSLWKQIYKCSPLRMF